MTNYLLISAASLSDTGDTGVTYSVTSADGTQRIAPTHTGVSELSGNQGVFKVLASVNPTWFPVYAEFFNTAGVRFSIEDIQLAFAVNDAGGAVADANTLSTVAGNVASNSIDLNNLVSAVAGLTPPTVFNIQDDPD